MCLLSGNISDAAAFIADHPDLGEAIQYLQRVDLASLPPGEKEIDGRRLCINVIHGTGQGRETALEAHNDYIDIHYTISGVEEIGFAPRSSCRLSPDGYQPLKDVEFFEDAISQWNPNQTRGTR